MVQSIELLFDPVTEAWVRTAWRTLADAGLPSSAHHSGATNRPHVTLAVAREAFAEGAADAVANVFAGWDLAERGLAAEIGAPLLFGGGRGWVLARLIVPTRRLLTLHEAVHRALGGAAEVVPETRPDSWTAHVTLARRMPADRLGEAVAVLAPPAPRGLATNRGVPPGESPIRGQAALPTPPAGHGSGSAGPREPDPRPGRAGCRFTAARLWDARTTTVTALA